MAVKNGHVDIAEFGSREFNDGEEADFKDYKETQDKEHKDEWLVKVDDGSVAFGSAYHNWAIYKNEDIEPTYAETLEYI